MRHAHDNGFWGLCDHADKVAFVEAWIALRYESGQPLPTPRLTMPVERECDPLASFEHGGES